MASSVVTGSILVNYDAAILRPEVLDEHLRRLGAPSGIRAQAEASFERVIPILVRKVFEHVVEALAVAAIEAAI